MNYKYIEISERLPDYEELVWEVNHTRKFVLLIRSPYSAYYNKYYEAILTNTNSILTLLSLIPSITE